MNYLSYLASPVFVLCLSMLVTMQHAAGVVYENLDLLQGVLLGLLAASGYFFAAWGGRQAKITETLFLPARRRNSNFSETLVDKFFYCGLGCAILTVLVTLITTLMPEALGLELAPGNRGLLLKTICVLLGLSAIVSFSMKILFSAHRIEKHARATAQIENSDYHEIEKRILFFFGMGVWGVIINLPLLFFIAYL